MDLPNQKDLLTGGVLGFWALLGAIIKTGADWRDPETSRFSYGKLLTALATALVLGQGAGALGDALHWEPAVIGLIASILGYLGPAAAMVLLEKRFLPGAPNVSPNNEGK